EPDAQKAAVKGHAALPDYKELQRIMDEHAGLIQEKKPNPAAEHGAYRCPKEKIVGLIRLHRRRAAPEPLLLAEPAHIEPAENEANKVGEAVPAYPVLLVEMDCHRIVEGECNCH